MTLIVVQHRVEGVLTNATSVKLSDPTETYGLKRTDTDEILVADDTAFSSDETGVYEYDLADPEPGLTYDYWVEIVYDSETIHYHRLQSASETIGTRRLEFVCAADGAVVDLAASPKLSSPTGGYGAVRTDTGATVVSDGEDYTEVGTGLYRYTLGELEDGLIYRYYVEVIHDSVTYHVPRTTAYTNAAMLAIGRYTTSLTIESLFGPENVHKWLGVDEHEAATDYALRAYQHIADAESHLDDLLRGSAVVVPVESPIQSVISRIATLLAGVRMYESRGTTDFDPETGQPQHRLHYQRKEADRMIAQLKSGQIRLSVETATRYPQVLCEDE
jgi:hypothetical protein